MKKQITITIPMSELQNHEYVDYSGYVFRMSDGSYRILSDEEEIRNNNKWNCCLPIDIVTVSEINSVDIKIGQWIMCECANNNLNLKPLKFLGLSEEGYNLIDIESEIGDKITTTIFFLQDAFLYHRKASESEKLEWIENENRGILKIA